MCMLISVFLSARLHVCVSVCGFMCALCCLVGVMNDNKDRSNLAKSGIAVSVCFGWGFDPKFPPFPGG